MKQLTIEFFHEYHDNNTDSFVEEYFVSDETENRVALIEWIKSRYIKAETINEDSHGLYADTKNGRYYIVEK